MADDFFAENNSCGQVLLQLVSRGNAIIAELLRLKDYIPPVFKLETKKDKQKYSGLLLDFEYFRNADEYEKKIENDTSLSEYNEEIKENHLDLLTRFYVAFESIHKFITELNQYVKDLEHGVYIQQNLESVFINEDGRQLLCEAVYLYGVMLLVVDIHISGQVRERILISYYRYSAQRLKAGSNLDDVCKLLRSSDSIKGRSYLNYFEGFERLCWRSPPNRDLLNLVIGRLHSDDLYNQIAAYPFPEHRTTALASQAAMLFVCLFFDTDILMSQTAKIRNIVDKYFADNWVVSVYMGMTVNLIDAWHPFKAASSALANTLELSNIRQQSTHHAISLENLLGKTKKLLKEGTLTQDNIVEHVNQLINLIRDSNVTLRWLMLHTAPNLSSHKFCNPEKKSKQIRDQVMADVNQTPKKIFRLLLNTAELELKVKDLFKAILSEREQKWVQCRTQCEERIIELAEVFSGAKPLTRIDKNENLQKWFVDIGKQINTLNVEEPTISSRKIIRLIEALGEVQEFHHLKRNLQVRQFLEETRCDLNQMVQGLKVTEAVLINLQIVGDISYGWELIDGYTDLMQEGIHDNPRMIERLRAIFLKLSSAMEIPLLRINQANSQDLVSVSQYYSHELVSYVRNVLHIIPKSMFTQMAKIVELQTSIIKELPTRLDKDKLKDYAHLEHRTEVANLTHLVSEYTQGILRMKSTLVGIVTIDPKQLLEDGIRKELVHHIALALHKNIDFKAKASDCSGRMEYLGKIMEGHRRSFEYIQDYIEMNGLKIWQEELSRVIGFNVDMECNNFLRVKVLPWQSIHQSKAIPVPLFEPTDSFSTTFVGRLARELINVTNPKTTFYLMTSGFWFNRGLVTPVADMILFTRISSAIGISGITGLDRLISFIIVAELQSFLVHLQRGLLKDKTWTDLFGNVAQGLGTSDHIVTNPARTYIQWYNRASKAWPRVLKTVLKIGQLQLLRRHIFFELRTGCKFEAKNLSSALENMNEALLNDIRNHYKDPTSKPYPSGDSQLLLEVSTYLDWAGIGDPFAKIYVTTKNLQYFSLFMFLFVIAELNRFEYSKIHGTLMWNRRGDAMDGPPFVIGVATLFRQFHPEIRSQFLVYMAQFVKSHIDNAVSNPSRMDLPSEIINTLHFLLMFADVSDIPYTELCKHIPEAVLDLFTIFNPIP